MIVAVAALCAVQAALVAALLVQRSRQRRAEYALRASEAARRSSDREAQTLAGRLILSQESERRRIARDLHDNLSQKLALLCIDIECLGTRTPAPAPLAEAVAHLFERAADIAERRPPPVARPPPAEAGNPRPCTRNRKPLPRHVAPMQRADRVPTRSCESARAGGRGAVSIPHFTGGAAECRQAQWRNRGDRAFRRSSIGYPSAHR